MAQSPYVSYAVLETLAKSCPAFPYSVALDVFLANPSPTTEPKFLLMLETETTFPTYMIDMVANNTGQSLYRDKLEENLAKSHMAFIDAKGPIIRYNWRQPTTTNAQRIADLETLESVNAELHIIDLLWAEGNTAEAQGRLDSIDSKFGFNTRIKREQSEYYNWIEILNNNASLENLPAGELAKLRTMAQDYYYTTAGKKAMIVLNNYYHEDHFIPAYYGTGSASVRSFTAVSNQKPEVHLMTIFPNPTSEYLQLKLDLGNLTPSNETCLIYDAVGKLIESIKVNNAQQTITVNTSEYAPGSYQIILQKDNYKLETISFNVVH